MNIKTFFMTLILVPLLDFVWLGMIMSSYYSRQMESIGRIADGKFQPVYWSGGVVYILLAFGMSIFVDPKIRQVDSIFKAFGCGAIFGLIGYGIYDFTNYATLKDWPLQLSLVDMAWGGVVCGLIGIVIYITKA